LDATFGRDPLEVSPVRPSDPLASLPTTNTAADDSEEATFDRKSFASTRSDMCLDSVLVEDQTIAGAAAADANSVETRIETSFIFFEYLSSFLGSLS
jgi:hypothetical protein